MGNFFDEGLGEAIGSFINAARAWALQHDVESDAYPDDVKTQADRAAYRIGYNQALSDLVPVYEDWCETLGITPALPDDMDEE